MTTTSNVWAIARDVTRATPPAVPERALLLSCEMTHALALILERPGRRGEISPSPVLAVILGRVRGRRHDESAECFGNVAYRYRIDQGVGPGVDHRHGVGGLVRDIDLGAVQGDRHAGGANADRNGTDQSVG